MAVATAVAIGGAVVQGISSLIGGSRKRRLARERARQKELQRQEIRRRTESEIDVLRDNAGEAVGLANIQYAGSGIDVSSGASVQALMQSYENLGRTIYNKRYEAQFRMDQLSLEERWELKQGQALYDSSVVSAIGGLVKSGISIYNNMSSSDSTLELDFSDSIEMGADNYDFGGIA